MKKNILITGGLGFIGSKLSSYFCDDKNFNVHIVDINRSYLKHNEIDFFDFKALQNRRLLTNKCIIHNVDLKNSFQTLKIINEIKPIFIIHLAALPLANISNEMAEETISSILKTTVNLIEASKIQKNKPKFILSSSSMVYGNFNKKKIDENHPLNPINMYGSVKLSTELIFKNLCDVNEIQYMIIRPSAVYGPNDLNKRVLQIFIDKALQNEQIIVNGKDLLIDFTFIDDIAKAFYFSVKNFNPGIYNFTSSDPKTLIEVITYLKKSFPNLIYKFKEKEKFVPIRGALSNKLYNSKVKNFKRTKFKDGFSKYISFKLSSSND